MSDNDRDTLIRMAAFEHVRRLGEVHDHLTVDELKWRFVLGLIYMTRHNGRIGKVEICGH